MRMMVYRGTGGFSVRGDGFGREFEDGAYVDFDELAGHVVRDAGGTNEDGTPKQKRLKVTWADAIGEKYAHLFEPVSKKKAAASAAAGTGDVPDAGGASGT
jgi:hypothetical protein